LLGFPDKLLSACSASNFYFPFAFGNPDLLFAFGADKEAIALPLFQMTHAQLGKFPDLAHPHHIPLILSRSLVQIS
jgi:hypothetical protein